MIHLCLLNQQSVCHKIMYTDMTDYGTIFSCNWAEFAKHKAIIASLNVQKNKINLKSDDKYNKYNNLLLVGKSKWI